jgi:predicted ATPase
MHRSGRSDNSKSRLAFDNVHLYNREDEVKRLKEAYKESSRACQIVWLYGYGGVGKTTLVQIAFQGEEHYCHGKFDRIGSPQPFAAIVALLSRLCLILEFGFPAIHVSADVALILSKLLPDSSQVLSYDKSEVVADMKNLGASHCVPDKRHEWGFEKLKDAVRTFVKGACDMMSVSSSPLILHLDDLQWADEDSMQIIRALLAAFGDNSIKGLLFIGSYRDNEIAEDSPLTSCKKSIAATHPDQVREIEVHNLTRSAVDSLVASLTGMPLLSAEPLGELIYAKTLGNAFFSIRLMQHLHSANLLRYSDSNLSWEWNADRIRHEVDMSDNVLDFMMKTLNTLPPTTAEVLKIASFLGSKVDMLVLEHVRTCFDSDLGTQSLTESLEAAVSANLIVMDSRKSWFKFAHDRIQDAAYGLVSTGTQRQTMHLRIGQQLQSMKEDEDAASRHWTVVLAVDQLNRGSDLLEEIAEKVELARLNLLAAEEVIATSAFKMAQDFLATGIDLLGMRRWSQQYELTLEISNKLAFVLFSNGSMDECLGMIDQIYRRSRCDEDRYEAQFLHVEVLASLNRLTECIDVSLSIVSQLGHRKLPKNPSLLQILPGIVGVKKLLRNKSDADLLSLPLCDDKRLLAILRHRKCEKPFEVSNRLQSFSNSCMCLCLLSVGFLSPVAYLANREALSPVLTCRMMRISLLHGVSELTPYAFSSYGFTMTVIGDFAEAVRFATLALQLMSRLGEEARTLTMVYGLLNHLTKPVLDMTSSLVRAYQLGFSQGDLTFAGNAIAMHCAGRLVAGCNLENLITDIFSFCRHLKAYKQIMMWYSLATMQRSCLELTGRSNEMVKLTRKVLDDTAFDEYLRIAKAKMCEFIFWMLCSMCRYYLGDMASAIKLREKCWQSSGFKGAFVYAVKYFFFSALIALEQWKQTYGPRRFRYWRIFRKNHRELQSWVAKGNPNARHLAYLLDAVYLSTQKGKDDEVKRMYDKSIALARRGGFVHDAALANEFAGVYFLNKLDTDLASLYLQRSKALYTDWGASAKVEQMDAKYGFLVETDSSSSPRSLSVAGRSRGEIVDLVEKLRKGPFLS